MANRTKKFKRGLVTGYTAILVNIGYTIASVPLALHYLGKEEFGLWALAQQVAGYMLLLDFGMSSAISRFYSDCKDNVNGTEYKQLLSTSILVYAIQGGLIAFGGALFSWIAPSLFHIPDSLAHPFQVTLLIITVSSGVSVALRSVGGPIWSFQRMDVTNMMAISAMLTNFAVLWFGFRAGWGIYSFALAGVPSVILTPFVAFTVCSFSGYYPKCGSLEKPSRKLFWRLFNFGRDTMLLSLGQQMVNASQIILISRCIGLDAAATFTIGVKLYSMGQQFISKILESSAAGLTELFVRGDHARFRKRFWDIVEVSTLLGCIGAAVLVLGNQSLIRIWTKGVVDWPSYCDPILALMLISSTFSRCFTGIFGLVGDIRPIRYIYFIEGVCFLIIAWFGAKHFGIFGVLLASLFAHITITFFRSVVSAKYYLESITPIWKIASYVIAILASALVANYVIVETVHDTVTKTLLEGVTVCILTIASAMILLNIDLRNKILTSLVNKL
jgi:O-antigen/teichoic acid export membrane protein